MDLLNTINFMSITLVKMEYVIYLLYIRLKVPKFRDKLEVSCLLK